MSVEKQLTLIWIKGGCEAKSSVSGCSPNVASLQWEHAIAMRVHAGRCQPEVLPSNDINQDEGGKGE
jgi:hypothetical protein